MEKKLNPYQRLKQRGNELFCDIIYCRRRTMVEIEIGGGRNYSLLEIQQRVIAADQLKYEVVVISDGNKLRFEYRNRRPESIPYDFQI